MVERMNPVLPISQQCRLLVVPRSSVYRKPAEISAEDLAMMALIDRQYLARPYYGSRRMAAWLATQGHRVNRKRVQRLMRLLGLTAIYQRPNTSKPAAAHKIYPYLLGGLEAPWPESAGLPPQDTKEDMSMRRQQLTETVCTQLGQLTLCTRQPLFRGSQQPFHPAVRLPSIG
jgi:putative transposase